MKKPLNLLVVALLGACASSPEGHNLYLLAAQAEKAQQCSVAMGHASLPGYLQRANIVVQTSNNQITPATTHRWAEPLQEATERVLAGCMADNDERKVDVSVQRFHGTTSGATMLEATWQLRGSADSVRFSAERIQSGSGYDALVNTQRSLLIDLCSSICEAVR